MNGFSNSASVVTQLAAFDAIVDRTAGRDRADLLAIRAYFEILFLRVLAEPVKRSESERSAALRRFFRTDGPRLDFRLRNECRVSLEGELAPFVAQPASS